MSICAVSMMSILFFSETWAFLSTRVATSIALDDNVAPQIQLNFNITMMDLQCDYIVVDVWDALGTNRQNVTKNVDKWQLDSAGVRRMFSGRNREARELLHDHAHGEVSVDDVIAEHGGETAVVDLTKDNFAAFLAKHEMAFVDLYAPWCVWCQRLAPTWEKFAQEISAARIPVGVGKIDCVDQADLCREQKTMAFPTLRWYHNGEIMQPDYKMDRTVPALMGYAKRKLDMDEKYKNWRTENEHLNETEKDSKRKLFQQNRPDHPGCQVSGYLMVNRVPGNFHIEARSKNHNLNSAMTNLSHVVNHLSFGEPIDEKSYKVKRILKQVPPEHKQFSPLDNQQFSTSEFHQAYHHYIKVVSTHLRMTSSSSPTTAPTSKGSSNSLMTYQYLEQSQIVYYDEVNVPEARFSYDLSPMSVVVEKRGRKWYDYLTSLCAIIGGSFTTLGLIDAFLYRVLKPKKL
jgi:thiol-disulfide isomerase/thioredoxin